MLVPAEAHALGTPVLEIDERGDRLVDNVAAAAAVACFALAE